MYAPVESAAFDGKKRPPQTQYNRQHSGNESNEPVMPVIRQRRRRTAYPATEPAVGWPRRRRIRKAHGGGW
jgi:hypothetical protein